MIKNIESIIVAQLIWSVSSKFGGKRNVGLKDC